MLHRSKFEFVCLVLVSVAVVSGQQANNCSVQDTKPDPKVQKYILKTCIVGQFAGYLTTVPQAKYLAIEDGTVDVTESRCGDDKLTPKLVVNFKCGNIHLTFNRNNANQTFVESITGTYTDKNSTVTFSNSTPAFTTSAPGHYYKCDAEQTVSFHTVSLTLKNMALEVYRNVSGTDFYQIPDDCYLDSQPVSNVVRIGVGVALLALVAIVIVAYFVGRRRWAERSTYESV